MTWSQSATLTHEYLILSCAKCTCLVSLPQRNYKSFLKLLGIGGTNLKSLHLLQVKEEHFFLVCILGSACVLSGCTLILISPFKFFLQLNLTKTCLSLEHVVEDAQLNVHQPVTHHAVEMPNHQCKMFKHLIKQSMSLFPWHHRHLHQLSAQWDVHRLVHLPVRQRVALFRKDGLQRKQNQQRPGLENVTLLVKYFDSKDLNINPRQMNFKNESSFRNSSYFIRYFILQGARRKQEDSM